MNGPSEMLTPCGAHCLPARYDWGDISRELASILIQVACHFAVSEQPVALVTRKVGIAPSAVDELFVVAVPVGELTPYVCSAPFAFLEVVKRALLERVPPTSVEEAHVLKNVA